jgi:hypothetical protein
MTIYDDGKRPVNITIAEKRYSFRLTEEDEEFYRKAEKMINAHIGRYEKYSNAHPQDKMLLTILHFALEFIRVNRLNNDKTLLHEVERLDSELGNYLERQGSLDNIE